MKRPRLRTVCSLPALLLLASCSSSQKSEVPPENPPAKQVVAQAPEVPQPPPKKAVHAPKPDLSQRAEEEKFQKYVKRLAISCMNTAIKSEQIKGCFTFEVPHKEATRLLNDLHEASLREGAYLFRLKNTQGKGDGLDLLAIMPTTDRYEVVAAVGTGNAENTIGSQDIIDWLRQLETQQPFILTGIGTDFVESQFTSELKESQTLAQKVAEFCPSAIDKEKEQLADLSKRLTESKNLLLKW